MAKAIKKAKAKAKATKKATGKGPKSPMAKVAAALKAQKVTAEFSATAAGCLDQEVATNLVFSCTGVGPVNVATKLGQLFPGPTQRRGFCGCVFNKARIAGSGIGAGAIPCEASTKVSDVIDSISC